MNGKLAIIIVHGVNTRLKQNGFPPFKKSISHAFFNSIFVPNLDQCYGTVSIEFPYWGDLGAKLTGYKALPDHNEEAFGKLSQDPINEKPDFSIVDIALYDELASLNSSDANYLSALVSDYGVKALELSSKIDTQSDSKTVTKILADFKGEEVDPEEESFGAVGFHHRVAERIERLLASPGRIISNHIIEMGSDPNRNFRESLNSAASGFLGDALTFLANESKRKDILTRITQSLLDFERFDRIIVVGHSLGGIISVEAVSDLPYEMRAKCDLVTVGSQVAFFSELGVLRNHEQICSGDFVRKWINIFDEQDFLSFTIGDIYPLAEDFRYSTGNGLITSHGSYFKHASFYEKLAGRLSVV